MTILEIVSSKAKTLLSSGAITEVDAQLAIDEVEQTIKNYCSVSLVPAELNFTWANMAVDLLKYDHAVNSTGDVSDIDSSEVSSLKIGDTQVQLGGTSEKSTNQRATALRSHVAGLDAIIMNYKDQLNKQRRMVW
jgi:hypothetical protein